MTGEDYVFSFINTYTTCTQTIRTRPPILFVLCNIRAVGWEEREKKQRNKGGGKEQSGEGMRERNVRIYTYIQHSEGSKEKYELRVCGHVSVSAWGNEQFY